MDILNLDPFSLFFSLIFGCVGFGYFRYGKKMGRFILMVCGIGLMVYPYFVTNHFYLVGIGVLLCGLPFIPGLRE